MLTAAFSFVLVGVSVSVFGCSLLTAYCLSLCRRADVFPVPRFIIIRTEAELVCVLYEPAVNIRLNLNRAVRVLRLNGVAADVEVERAARGVRAVDGESGATRVRR